MIFPNTPCNSFNLHLLLSIESESCKFIGSINDRSTVKGFVLLWSCWRVCAWAWLYDWVWSGMVRTDRQYFLDVRHMFFETGDVLECLTEFNRLISCVVPSANVTSVLILQYFPGLSRSTSTWSRSWLSLSNSFLD